MSFPDKWLIEQFRAQKVYGLLFIATTVASLTVFLLLPPWASRLVEQLRPGIPQQDILTHIVIGAGIYLLSALMTYARSSITSLLVNNIMSAMRVRIYSHILAISPRQSRSSSTDDLISSVSHDVQMYNSALANIISVLAPSLFLATCFVLAMAWYSLPLFVCVLLIILPIVLVTIFFSKFIYSMSHESQRAMARLLRKFQEAINGAREIKAFAQEERFLMRFEEANRVNNEIQIRRDRFDALHPIAVGLTAAAGIAVLLSLSVLAVNKQIVALNDLTAFMTCALLAYGPAQQASFAATRTTQFRVVMERLARVLDIPKEASGGAKLIPSERGIKIEFQNMSFAYKDSEFGFRNFNLAIPAGQTVALVGYSGAGKSTLIDFIPGFLRPVTGSVLIGDVDVSAHDLRALRELIGIVSQEPFLVEGTIRDNLLFGAPHASEFQIAAASRAAHVDEIINRQVNGVLSLVETNGRNLSVGQRQRIAIARVLLKNPSIFLLDEPTSALDGHSENLVREAIRAASMGRTTIIIAHRLSTVRSVDRIVVLSNGEIVEDGSHDQLYRMNGIYRHLYDSQFGYVSVDAT